MIITILYVFIGHIKKSKFHPGQMAEWSLGVQNTWLCFVMVIEIINVVIYYQQR